MYYDVCIYNYIYRSEGIVSPSTKSNKLLSFLQPKKNDTQASASTSKDKKPPRGSSSSNDTPGTPKAQIAEIVPEQTHAPVRVRDGPPPGLTHKEGPPPGLGFDTGSGPGREGPPPGLGFKREGLGLGPPETPPGLGLKSFKKNDNSSGSSYKDKRDSNSKRTPSKYQDDGDRDRSDRNTNNSSSRMSSSQYLLNCAKEMKKKHDFCYSKEEFLAVASTLERGDAFRDPPSDAMNEYYM